MGIYQSKSEYIVATNEKTTVFVRRVDVVYYNDLVKHLSRYFPNIDPTSIVVQTNELDVCAGRDVNIPPELWHPISPQIQNIKVVSRPIQNMERSIYQLRGKKPVIYLFSPLSVDALVRVSLVKAWSFSVVYPDGPIKDSELGQSITWNVKTHDDHTLTDMGTGTRLSYLFWEAKTNPGCTPSPPASPQMLPDAVQPFDPLRPQVTNHSSVVLPASKAAMYLDKALTSLGLHIEARTSFITFWLPSIQKHSYIALNFLPQASYEHAAPLDIEPKPDVVIRVFMLFRRVCEDELDEWEEALSRASQDAEFWKDIVGVDTERMKDEKLFRVLEWGGLEVKY